MRHNLANAKRYVTVVASLNIYSHNKNLNLI